MTRGGRWALVLYWALGIGHSMVIGYLVIGHWSFSVIHHSEFVIDSSFGFRNSEFAISPICLFAYCLI